jgi:hypothetical protein
MDILIGILAKCACGCKSDCCEREKTIDNKKTKKKIFHIEVNLGRKRTKEKSNTPSISSID